MNRITFRILIHSFLCIAAIGLLSSCATHHHRPIRRAGDSSPIRVACIGDSITYGYGIANREKDSYPAQLQALLGDGWQVRNFGFNGATALKKGTKPYSLLPVYGEALLFKPDVVVIKLGTNDTNEKSWPPHKEDFVADYLEIVRGFQNLETKPRIYLCRPVPLFRDRGKVFDTDKILTEEVIPKINEIARKKHLPVIDLYAALAGNAGMFPDGVHPDAAGAKIMATVIQKELSH
ncbi:MAG: Acetylesterase, lipase-GDSL family [Verrucomicrobiales bacterium]|nr:Acetylesterase, lipase-GDSL family [Verrucomicrobiales bacterium]